MSIVRISKEANKKLGACVASIRGNRTHAKRQLILMTFTRPLHIAFVENFPVARSVSTFTPSTSTASSGGASFPQ